MHSYLSERDITEVNEKDEIWSRTTGFIFRIVNRYTLGIFYNSVHLSTKPNVNIWVVMFWKKNKSLFPTSECWDIYSLNVHNYFSKIFFISDSCFDKFHGGCHLLSAFLRGSLPLINSFIDEIFSVFYTWKYEGKKKNNKFDFST